MCWLVDVCPSRENRLLLDVLLAVGCTDGMHCTGECSICITDTMTKFTRRSKFAACKHAGFVPERRGGLRHILSRQLWVPRLRLLWANRFGLYSLPVTETET